ncbi:hypothetical protein REPUB_Repub10bG0019900 [Reevesia pubescens]
MVMQAFSVEGVYGDMMLDGVKPTRDTFEALIMGTMRGARLQDAFFFRDEMKAMGLVPEVALFNFLISTCGKCKNSNLAIQVCLSLAIVRDMTVADAALNKFCYAGLIVANMNKIPRADDVATKIIELVEQSKGWSSLESSGNTGNAILGIREEELYNLPTTEFVHRRFFLYREFTVYHVAFHACAKLRNVEVLSHIFQRSTFYHPLSLSN